MSRKGLFSVNTEPHVANIVKETIAKFGLELLSHPPYLPDLVPFDYHLFRSLSNSLEDRKFENEEELKVTYLQDFFDSRPEDFYDSGICDLPSLWTKAMDTNGEYILNLKCLVFKIL